MPATEPSSRSTSSRSRSRHADRRARRFSRRAHRAANAKQTLYSGLAFSRDGSHIYASMASITDPEGDEQGYTGSGIVVYSFTDGKIAPERLIPLPVEQLPRDERPGCPAERKAIRACLIPAAIAVLGAGRPRKTAGRRESFRRCGAARRSDRRNRKALRSLRERRRALDLSHALAVTKDGKRAFVALWNASEIVELDLAQRHGRPQAGAAQAAAPSRRERIPAPSPSRPTRKRSTWRSPIAMPLRP